MKNNSITLNNNVNIPIIGLGTWMSKPGQVGKAVEYAVLEAGYRHIDAAAAYENEKEIGNAFTNVFKKIKREDIFITSKLWNTNHHPDNIEKALRKTLSDLRLEYLDLYLMHWGIAFKHGTLIAPIGKNGIVLTESVPIQDTWKGMEQLVRKGLVKSIGVANFSALMLGDLLTYAKVKPVMNQIELHPYNTQQALVDFCLRNDIAVTAYSPLGRQGEHTQGPKLFDERLINKLASKYKKTQSQILLRWAIQRGTVIIPKSVTPERIKENIGLFDFELTKEEKEQMSALNKNLRFVDPYEAWGIPCFS